MSAYTQVFMALDRIATEEFLMMAAKEMDDLTLKNATYVFISSYKPHLLKGLAKSVVPAWTSALDTLTSAADHVESVNEVILLEAQPKAPYLPPPKVRDAEENWPFMRCKNVAYTLRTRCGDPKVPRSHHALLEHIAKIARVSVETLKKTSPLDLFKDNYPVMRVLPKSLRRY